MPNTRKLIVFVGICFSTAVNAPAIVVDISVGPISSNGGSGPMLPPIDRSSFLLYDETGWNDAIVYGAALKWVTASRFYPVFGLRFARRDVWTKGGFRRNWVGNTSGGERWISLSASSRTNLHWFNFGLESVFPKRKDASHNWRGLMFGLGGSIFHAEDRMYPGSRYITHFEQWERTGYYDGKPGQVQLMHEEQNFDDLSSSGFGVGWYFLLGFRFYFSETISITPHLRFDYGRINVKDKDTQILDDLVFEGTTIALSGSIHFRNSPLQSR